MKFSNCIKALVALVILCIAGCQKSQEDVPKPIASFSLDKSAAVLNEVVTFTNTSQNATIFEWNFGDGNTSTIKNPTHSYSTTGSFTITLSATGEGGNASVSKTITISYPTPVASFTMDKPTAKVGETITFTNTSQNTTIYLWDFGDGNTSTDENPTYSYSSDGIFNITLNATGDGGTNAASTTITIFYPAPIASFTMDKTTANTGEAISFTNNSQFATSYAWNFGDDETSTETNATHSYSATGTFTITLTATGDGGTNTSTKTIEIKLPPYNIVPGDRIGDFKLGYNLTQLKSFITETWGQHLGILMNNGMYLHLLKYNQTGIGFFWESNSVSMYGTDIPDAIYAFTPFQGSTEKGITFGSLLTDVATAYGPPEQISSAGSYSYLTSLGISFWADDTKTKVEEIYIEKPGSTKSSGISFSIREELP